jgi:hypothetical protein
VRTGFADRAGAHAAFDARRRVVLAFTCAVHLLALFLWTQERRFLPVRAPRAVTILLQPERGRAVRAPAETAAVPLPMPTTLAAPAIPVPAPQPAPVQQRDGEDDARRVPRTDAAATADRAPLTAPSTPDAATPASAPNVIDTAHTPSLQGGFAAGVAKHQAGRIDRELRKGKPGVPTEADTPWARFERGLESAHIDRSLTLQSDTYTSPDGVVIYRFRRGSQVRCRRAGGLGMPLRGMADGAATLATAGSAGDTDCPKGVTWNRDGP